MKLRFSKMHGAGNDFVVLDATRGAPELSAAQYRWLADRRLGVGADQILIVGASTEPGVDFTYRIINADGGEVEQCGNGARCFARFVHDSGLTDKTSIRVRTAGGIIEPRLQGAGRVCVDMGAPIFTVDQVPFHAEGLPAHPAPLSRDGFALWPLTVGLPMGSTPGAHNLDAAVLSMGNPHAVINVAQFAALGLAGADDVDAAPVAELGPQIEGHTRFPRRVNAGFMQVVARDRIRLRVYERGAGETLACGSGACAAAVAGMRAGWLAPRVDVETRGGVLTIEWAGAGGDLGQHVWMTGPTAHVFDGELDVPDLATSL